jgi:hypothetical protein
MKSISFQNTVLIKTLNFIVENYNSLLEKEESILSNFIKIGQIATFYVSTLNNKINSDTEEI